MNSKTKIVVLHMKEIIYTVIFAVLTVLLILFLIFMFGSGHKKRRLQKRLLCARSVYFWDYFKQYGTGSRSYC